MIDELQNKNLDLSLNRQINQLKMNLEMGMFEAQQDKQNMQMEFLNKQMQMKSAQQNSISNTLNHMTDTINASSDSISHAYKQAVARNKK